MHHDIVFTHMLTFSISKGPLPQLMQWIELNWGYDNCIGQRRISLIQASLVLCIEKQMEALHFCLRNESVVVHWAADEEWTCCTQVELDVVCSCSGYSPGYLATLMNIRNYPNNETPKMSTRHNFFTGQKWRYIPAIKPVRHLPGPSSIGCRDDAPASATCTSRWTELIARRGKQHTSAVWYFHRPGQRKKHSTGLFGVPSHPWKETGLNGWKFSHLILWVWFASALT